MSINWVQYICTWCGAKATRAISAGRPLPGSCNRKGKTNDGRSKPHTWVVNKKY